MPFSGVLTKLNEPSDYATTDLPEKGDRPGSGSIELIMADVVSQKRLGSASTTESYAKSPACATSANSRCIIRASNTTHKTCFFKKLARASFRADMDLTCLTLIIMSL